MKRNVLIVASGNGSRFESAEPKQFALVNSRPVLMHTFDAFLKTNFDFRFVLVLSKTMTKQWENLCKQHHFTAEHLIVEGGSSRLQSVKNGLEYIPEGTLVAIHDGVRPVVPAGQIEKGFKLAAITGSAVPVIRIDESVRIIDGKNNKALNRQMLRLVQTPQFFHSSLIKKAYAGSTRTDFTDDASVYENAGHKTTLFEGDRHNIKITWPEQINQVKQFLK